MTKEEAYKLFFGKNLKDENKYNNLTKDNLKKRYRDLLKKHHPNAHRGDNAYHEVGIKVLLAYDVLNTMIGDKENKSTTKKEYHYSFDQYTFVEKKVYDLLLIEEYLIMDKLQRKLQELEYQMKNTSDLSLALNLAKEANSIYKEAMQSKKNKKSLGDKILNSVINNKISIEDLESSLRELAGKEIDLDDHEFLIDEAKVWQEKEQEKKLKKINNSYSYLINISNKIKEVIIQAKDLNDIILYTKLAKLSSHTLSFFGEENSLEEEIEVYTEYEQEKKEIIKLITYYSKETIKIINKIDELDNKDIDEELINKIKIFMLNNLPQEYYSLEDIKKYQLDYPHYKNVLAKNEYMLARIFKNIKKKLQLVTKENEKISKEVHGLYQFQTKNDYQSDASKSKANITTENIKDTYNGTNTPKINALDKAINLYYRFFIYYYACVKEDNIIDTDMDILYQQYLNKEVDADNVYKIMSNIYRKYMKEYQKEYNKDFTMSYKNSLITEKVLKNQIIDLLEYIKKLKLEIPTEVSIEKIEYLDYDILELEEIYRDLSTKVSNIYKL